MRKISIEINDIKLAATISNTKTAMAIYDSLPIKGTLQRWGDEIMVEFPVQINEDGNTTRKVEIGDIAYSANDASLCLFFGRTPLSTGKKPVAQNLVNVIGKIEGNPDILKTINSQSQVQIKKWSQQKSDSSRVVTKGRVIPLWRDTA